MKDGHTLFRINRDVRFSKDKSPYKSNLGALIGVEGRKAPGMGPLHGTGQQNIRHYTQGILKGQIPDRTLQRFDRADGS